MFSGDCSKRGKSAFLSDVATLLSGSRTHPILSHKNTSHFLVQGSTLPDKTDWTIPSVWSNATLIRSNVGRAGTDPPTSKKGDIFLMIFRGREVRPFFSHTDANYYRFSPYRGDRLIRFSGSALR